MRLKFAHSVLLLTLSLAPASYQRLQSEHPANGEKAAGAASYDFGIRLGADGGRIFYEQSKTVSAKKN